MDKKAVFATPYKESEQSECLQFRYIYCQCYEIKLPGPLLSRTLLSAGE